jgi:hypothetical protein
MKPAARGLPLSRACDSKKLYYLKYSHTMGPLLTKSTWREIYIKENIEKRVVRCGMKLEKDKFFHWFSSSCRYTVRDEVRKVWNIVWDGVLAGT